MTALEEIGSPPTRLDGSALYDWDYLVQEDRAHRLIYTDPIIFEAEMTHVFGGTWTYLAHESEIPRENDFITGRMGLRPLIIVRDGTGKIRALYNRCTPSRHDALPLGERQRQVVPMPLPRLELPQHRQAARRAVAGRLRHRHARSEIQHRPGAAR